MVSILSRPQCVKVVSLSWPVNGQPISHFGPLLCPIQEFYSLIREKNLTSRSCKALKSRDWCQHDCIALKFDRRLDSNAAEAPIKLQSNRKTFYHHFAASSDKTYYLLMDRMFVQHDIPRFHGLCSPSPQPTFLTHTNVGLHTRTSETQYTFSRDIFLIHSDDRADFVAPKTSLILIRFVAQYRAVAPFTNMV